jgi:hypothetical protein
MYIAGGDYNAKYTNWGSRLTSPRGRVLLKTLESNNFRHLVSGDPTYWPTVRLSSATLYKTPNSPYSAQNQRSTCHQAAFLDISQAFDRVWHTGLLHKLRQFLPLNYYLILIICITDISKSRLKIHTQTTSPLTREYLKVVSLALYFTSSTLLTYKPPQTLL